jgi:peptide/nickel transport system substrate-binding protein
MNHKRIRTILSTIILLSMILATLVSRSVRAIQSDSSTPDADRTGAWVDTINISTVSSSEEAVNQLEAGTLDIYTGISSDPALYHTVLTSQDVVSHVSLGNYNELTLNPAGPVFPGTGKLNPFAVSEIREAMNWLVDRGHIVQQILGGLGVSKYFCILTSSSDYARYHDTVQTLEAYYAYDYDQANTVIAAEMANLGATLVDGKWHYNGEPVALIFLIRIEDERRQIGDYLADQLESIGFTVDRQYKTSLEASALWLQSDPDDGLWHLYTGGWVRTAISRDEGGNFQFFYTPSAFPFPLWQAYTPSPEFEAAADQLANRDYANMDERDQLFTDALEMSMLDSAHIFLVDLKGFSPRRADTTAAYDLVGGVLGSDLWPYTVRFIDQERGVMKMAQPSHLVAPWNPLGGSNWIYDSVAQRATQDEGVVQDPNNGLVWPQRIESAEIYAQAGLAITRTLDWVTLEFSPTIEVPYDTWVDWDAASQVWITASEKFTQTQTAMIKSVVYYPEDLLDTITWHDGSRISVADFVMGMIMPLDVAKPESAVYDGSRVDSLDAFLSTFKGYRITSTDPLIIEYYTDTWYLDAELNVHPEWPNYGSGEGAWHTMAVGYLADADQTLAFYEAKADNLGIEWMDFISEPSITILKGYLDQAQIANYVPYSNTLNTYMTAGEAAARWANLQAWYATQGHFWLGTGPLYVDAVSHDDGTLTLQRFPDFPDPAGKWDHFSHDASPPALELNYDSGAPGSSFNIVGTNFPINSMASISVNDNLLGTIFTGDSGTFTFTVTTDPEIDEGFYIVTVSVNPSASIMFQLDTLEPVRPQEGSYESFDIPDGIAIVSFIYLPLIER